jgi:hypothetical protein
MEACHLKGLGLSQPLGYKVVLATRNNGVCRNILSQKPSILQCAGVPTWVEFLDPSSQYDARRVNKEDSKEFFASLRQQHPE